MKFRSIAIDGPSGAGKSTISRHIAKKLGFIYVDTGAIYRAVGLFALRRGVDASDRSAVPALLPEISVSLGYEDGVQRVFLNGEDVSEDIREHEVSMAASNVSAIPEVRVFLLDLQRDMARSHDVIMDGRDIGTVVLPGADLKIFLTASPEERAERRYRELLSKGGGVPYEKVLADMLERDENDRNRMVAPAKPAPDAVSVVTDGKTFDESCALVEALIRRTLGL